MTYAIVAGGAGATVVGYPMEFALVTKAAQSDSVTFFNTPGIIPFIVYDLSNAASLSAGTMDWWEYSVIRNNGGELSTSNSIEYDTAVIGERNTGGYYLFAPASGEFIYVKKDDGTAAVAGNLTGCVRGALGTTAADITDNDYMLVMNTIILHHTRVGQVLIGYFRLPDDPKAGMTK